MRSNVLPNSYESERAVLAAILLRPTALSEVAGRLVPEDFYSEPHQITFAAMMELFEAGTDVDLRTLQAKLEEKDNFARVGGLAYLAGMDLELPDLGRVADYVEIVKNRAIRRRLILGCNEVGQQARGGDDIAAVLQAAEELVLRAGDDAAGPRAILSMAEALEATTVALEERGARPDGMLGLPSGFYDWDRFTQGLADGTLIVVAGRPGMGKTSFALNVAQNVSIRERKAVGLFSLEMSVEELTMRLLASESGIPFASVRSGRMSADQWNTLYRTIRRINGAPLHIDDTASLNIAELSSRARKLKRDHDVALVVIDYLQLMDGGGTFENRQVEVASISRAMKCLAKELEIPIMLLCQLSREPERRNNKRPQLADLRESGAIEQDADMVCFVYRAEVYNPDDTDVHGLAELIMAKFRNGPTGTTDLLFQAETTTFANLDTRYQGSSNQMEASF